VGVKQVGAPETVPCDAQHSCPVPQQVVPQHDAEPAAQLPASTEHGAVVHVPSQ
jgi:hypothetical protein